MPSAPNVPAQHFGSCEPSVETDVVPAKVKSVIRFRLYGRSGLGVRDYGLVSVLLPCGVTQKLGTVNSSSALC